MSRRDFAALVVVILWVFVTRGDPDIYDMLHSKAVAELSK